MVKRSGYQKVQIRLTGETGKVDGYMEIVVGMLFMTGVVGSLQKSKRSIHPGETQIYLELEMLPPPLGNLGEDDLPTYAGTNP
jgi:hypothetical protein